MMVRKNLFQRAALFCSVGVTLAAGLSAGVASAAVTEDHPRLAPMRDVTVVYHLLPQATGQAVDADGKNVKVAFSGSGDWVRIDAADGRGVTILDRPHNTVTLIMLEQHLYTQIHPQHGLHNPFLLDLSMHYSRAGQGVVAGVPCERWNASNAQGTAEACITQDGVILSENGVDADGAKGSIRAVSVVYHDLPMSTFAPPDGFHRLTAKPHAPGTSSAMPMPPAAGSTTLPGGIPDTGEPAVSDDSATDGTVTQPDQPPSSSGASSPDGPSPSVGGGQ